MPDDRQTMSDWLSAQQRLTSGRVSDPSQDAIGPAAVPGWWWQEQAYRQRQSPGLIPRPQDAEALPLGSLGDPVSQAAFLLAPGLLRGGKETLDLLAQPGYARQFGQGGPLKLLSGQRGNLGPPPVSEYGEALPRSVVRGADGKLTKLYHGTDKVYPDFDMAQSGSGAGGDLYGPGIYLTENPTIARDYATVGWGAHGQDAMHSLDFAHASRQYYVDQAANARTLQEALDHLTAAQSYDPLIAQAEQRMQKYADAYPHLFRAPANVRPVYADLKRPFDINADYLTPRDLDQLAAATRRHGMPPDFADRFGEATAGNHPVQPWGARIYEELAAALGKAKTNQILQDAGYDGITHVGGGNTGTAPHQVYIAFSPEHVYPAPAVEALR